MVTRHDPLLCVPISLLSQQWILQYPCYCLDEELVYSLVLGQEVTDSEWCVLESEPIVLISTDGVQEHALEVRRQVTTTSTAYGVPFYCSG